MRRGWSWHLGLGRELGNVFWAMVGVEAAFGAYMGIWPLWIEALGAPVTVVGLVLGSSGLLRLGTLGPSAALAERFGTRRLILLARAAAGLGMLSAALATHWTQLFVMVACSAIGELAFPLTQSHLAAHAGEQRVRAFTLVFNVGPAAALGLSPLVAGILVAAFGMRAAFVFAALCTAFSIAFFSRLSRDKRPEDGERAAGSSYREALADRPVRRLVLLQFTTIFVLALGVSFVPTFLADERGLTPATISMLGAVGSIGSVLFGLVVARTVRLQRAPLAAVAIAVALVATTLSVLATSHALWLIILSFLGRGGLFSAWGLFVAGIGEVVAERHRARSFALSEMMGGTAFSFAPMLAGQLYALRPVLPLASAVVLAVLLIPVLLRGQRTMVRAPAEAAVPQVEPELA